MFDMWLALEKDKWNHDPREATCQWFIDNYDFLMESTPKHYPRILRNSTDSKGLFYVCLIFGGLAIVCIVFASAMTIQKRNLRQVRYAQIEFLFLLLVGTMMVAAAAIIGALPLSNSSCVAVTWLTNLGFTLQLVPLIVKVAAINQLAAAARKMKRVVLSRRYLFGAVFLLSTCVVIYTGIWTIFDPESRDLEYEVTDTIVEETGETVVIVSSYCSSQQIFWKLSTLVVNCILLLCASVLAVQTRKTHKDFNESMTLAILVYSQFVFVVLRMVAYLLEDKLGSSMANYFQSLLHSCDTICTVFIYFVPKFVVDDATSFGSRGFARNYSGLFYVTEDTPTTRTRSSMAREVDRSYGGDVLEGEVPSRSVKDSSVQEISSSKEKPITCSYCGKCGIILKKSDDGRDENIDI
mmetsp:Transcript_3970/g.5848  ORF Transcript_3970/g.5848 Transcript_3970/m.5848 type:complete len:409 (+) Transcript_3970:3-1229(+)